MIRQATPKEVADLTWAAHPVTKVDFPEILIIFILAAPLCTVIIGIPAFYVLKFSVGIQLSMHHFWILYSVLLMCFLIPEAKRRRKMHKPSTKRRPALLADIQSRSVKEETLTITQAIRFREPEHQMLIYMLRTADDRVLVQYDYANTITEEDEADHEPSLYQPATQLTVAMGVTSRHVLSAAFSGTPIELSDPHDLTIHVSDWPKDGEWLDIPWDDLIAHYAKPMRTRKAKGHA